MTPGPADAHDARAVAGHCCVRHPCRGYVSIYIYIVCFSLKLPRDLEVVVLSQSDGDDDDDDDDDDDHHHSARLSLSPLRAGRTGKLGALGLTSPVVPYCKCRQHQFLEPEP